MPWRWVRLRPVLVAGVALLAAGSLAACDTSSATPYSSSSEVPATPTPSPTGQVLHLKISSSTLKDERALVVYLPSGYNDPANQSRRYPVLYLLSGAPGSADDWYWGMHAARTADRLIAAGTVPPMILASPDGNGGRLRDSQFVDSSDGRQPVETFLVRDVLGYVDAHFRTVRSRAGRGLVGYSSGAYGALNIGLHHPDLFATLAGYCGYYTADLWEVSDPQLNHPMSARPAFMRYNSPSFTIRQLRPAQIPAILISESTNDGYYTRTTRQFDAELGHLGIPHTMRLFAPRTAAERQNWPHTWQFVDYAFSQTLPAIASAFRGR